MTESVLSSRHKDCMPCRLVSGFGVIGMGVYVALQAQKRTLASSRIALYCIAAATGGVGVTRLLDVYPFGKSTE